MVIYKRKNKKRLNVHYKYCGNHFKGAMFMGKFLSNIPDKLINPVISAVAIITGAILGGLFSWIITRKNTCQSIEEQKRMEQEKVKRDRENIKRTLHEFANVVRLDICTAIYQSIRSLKFQNDENKVIIPINKNYSRAVAYLSDEMNLKELSYIYQLYGIIEKLNYDVKNLDYYDEKKNKIVNKDYEIIIKKIYGENYEQILSVDINEIPYEVLYQNDLIKIGYRKVLKKLDDMCIN